jgi:hypothetical protein
MEPDDSGNRQLSPKKNAATAFAARRLSSNVVEDVTEANPPNLYL